MRRLSRNIPILFSIVLFSCSNNKPVEQNPKVVKEDSLLDYDTKCCDSCSCVLVVHHEESTYSKDLKVDSGMVYITQKIYREFDSIVVRRKKASKADSMPLLPPPDKLSGVDLCLDDKSTFYKMWPDTVHFKDFGKYYRVRGKIVGFKAPDNLYFKVSSFTLLPKK